MSTPEQARAHLGHIRPHHGAIDQVAFEALQTVVTQAEQITTLQSRLDGQAWADLQAEVAELRAREERVQALHPMATLYAYCEGNDDECDRTDANHEEDTDHPGELLHLNEPLERVCGGTCRDEDGERLSYPCPTIRALDGAKPEETEHG